MTHRETDQDGGRRPITIEDVLALPVVGDPQMSPDGSQVVYTVTIVDRDANTYQTHLWLVPTGGGRPRQLTTARARETGPRWSPDGSQIAFVSDRSGDKQVWIIPVSGGEARVLTSGKVSPADLRWSPDGRSLAFVGKPPVLAGSPENGDVRVPHGPREAAGGEPAAAREVFHKERARHRGSVSHEPSLASLFAERSAHMSGRHFLQIPGPTNVPERVLRAMDRAVIDHRGPELPPIVEEVVRGLKELFATTRGEIVIYPTSGTGASEAAIVNTLNAGDRALAFNIGNFSHLYAECARRHGVVVDELDLPWDRGVSAETVHERLAQDTGHEYRAVLLVHNESATGVTCDVAAIRRAMDAAHHPALLLVDAISSLGSLDLQFDGWGIDVAIAGSQKGLMLPPGLGILCVSPRALEASSRVTTPRYFFDWKLVLDQMHQGYFPYTPATNSLFGLREALRMLQEEGLANVIARHRRLGEGVRRAVTALGLEILCQRPEEYSNSLTAVVVPDGKDANAVVRAAVEHLNLSLGWGLAKLRGKVFRIGHLGALNELEVLATIAGVEMACEFAGIRIPLGAGVTACERYFLEHRTASVVR